MFTVRASPLAIGGRIEPDGVTAEVEQNLKIFDHGLRPCTERDPTDQSVKGVHP